MKALNNVEINQISGGNQWICYVINNGVNVTIPSNCQGYLEDNVLDSCMTQLLADSTRNWQYGLCSIDATTNPCFTPSEFDPFRHLHPSI